MTNLPKSRIFDSMCLKATRLFLVLFCCALFLPVKVAFAGPVRLALSNYAPPGERNVGFIDAFTTTDGGLGVLTSGEAEGQPRLRLTRYDARGIRNWSRTILIPSPVVETGENLRQASLLATHDGNLLVLSQFLDF